jgi:hypothetical protein
MSDYEIGYRKPPRSGQFKAGVSGNPKGRPKRAPLAAADIISGVLAAPMQYREQGRTKTLTRQMLMLKVIVDRAVSGDLKAAEDVLSFRAHAQRHGEAGIERLGISDWLPDYAGQTGTQKTKDLSEQGFADAVERDFVVDVGPAIGEDDTPGGQPD